MTTETQAAEVSASLSLSDMETIETLRDIEAFFRKEAAYECENMGAGGSTIALGRWKRYYMALANIVQDLPELIANQRLRASPGSTPSPGSGPSVSETAGEVQRWSADQDYGCLVRDSDGEWCKYDDVRALTSRTGLNRSGGEGWIEWKPGDRLPDEMYKTEVWVMWQGAVSKRWERRLLMPDLWNECIKFYWPVLPPPPPQQDEG